MKRRMITTGLFILHLVACDSDETTERPAQSVDADNDTMVPELAKRDGDGSGSIDAQRTPRSSHPPVPGAKNTFSAIVKLIDEKYVDGTLTEDELWTGAIEGVLARLIQHDKTVINTLMTPRELEELTVGTKGSLVGVGVMIETVADVVVIRDLIPGGPAKAAGLRPGDRILAVDGKRTASTSLAALVDQIRGSAGTHVELFVQRDTEEWTVTITRAEIKFSGVESTLVKDAVGLVRLHGFTETVASDLDRALQELTDQGMRSLIVDLRGCPGGLLEPAVDVASRFLPQGELIMTLRGRDGVHTRFESEGESKWRELPLVVLVDEHTASGAEFVAKSLSDGGRATVAGQRTFGKGTVEMVQELDNGWGLKLTSNRIYLPSGEWHHGVGIEPDITLPASDSKHRLPVAEISADTDPQVRAAVRLLEH